MADTPHILGTGGQPQLSAAAAPLQVQATAPPVTKVIVVIATGWGPLYGGINSFSFDFSLALGRMLRGSVRVICLTTNVDDVTRGRVKSDHVEIFTLREVGPGTERAVASNARHLLNQNGIAAVELVFGHDVVTGPAAIELAALMGGKAALFHHMSYIQYQGVKKDGRTAIEMDADQKSVLRKAAYVIAVGPLLKESAERLCQRDVPMVVPGMAAIPPVTHRAAGAFRAITFGRMGGEDDPIKQGSLAVAGYGRYVNQSDVARADRTHQFTMYGLPQDQYAAEEKALKELMRKETGRQIPVNATVYTDDRQKLFDALADNEVALMLSWHEGFGLVGWEAIAAAVPLVVSKRTGLYKLLNSPDDPVGAACVSVVDVRGSDDGMPDDADVTAVADALFRIMVSWEQFYKKAITLRDHLAKKYTWEGCARDALKACAFPLVAADPEIATPPEGPTTPQFATREQEASSGGATEEQHRLVCADGGSKPTQQVTKAISILAVCPNALPLVVLSEAIGTSADGLRRLLSEHFDLVSGANDLWRLKDRSQLASDASSPDLLASALDSLLIFIRNHKKEPIGRSQADNAIEMGKLCVEQKPRTVAPLFDIIQTILKRRGNKKLVLEVARLSLKAARHHPRTDKETELEALTRICGEAWVFQRINRLADARAAANDSLALGQSISYDRNTAFCMKCIGRLLRIEAEQERDRTKKGKLLGDSEAHIEDAIRIFATVKDVGPNHKENGDCYSLLARTRLVAGKRTEAVRAAKKAKDFLTDENDKDYLDWCLLMGDLEAVAQKYQDAEEYYEQVLRKHQADDAEKSEIVARAYLAHGRARLATNRKPHAIADFEQAAKIWHGLGDIHGKSKAEWEKIKAVGDLNKKTITDLEKEIFPVRVETYRLHKLSDSASSEETLSRRAERTKIAWAQLVQEARKNMAVEEEWW